MASTSVHPTVQRGPTLRFDKLAPELREVLQEFDDGDGELNVMELAQTVHSLRDSRKSSRRNLCMAMAAVGVAVFMMLSVLALSFTAAKLANPTGVENGAFVASGTNEPLQVASTEFKTAADGSLKTHGGATVATRPALHTTKLNSTLPNAMFKSMQRLSLRFGGASSNDMLSLTVTGCARVTHAESLYGSVMRLVTPVGMCTLDGTRMYADDGLAAWMKAFGVNLEDHPSSPHGRRLRRERSRGRRLGMTTAGVGSVSVMSGEFFQSFYGQSSLTP